MAEPLHENDDLIIRYLDGELTHDELDRFTQRMENDPAFSDDVQNMRLSVEVVKLYGTQKKVKEVRLQMKQDNALVVQPPKVVNMKRMVRYGLTIAASIFLVFIAIEGYRFYNLSPDAVYKETFISYSVSDTRGEQTVSDIQKAYSAKQYDAVILIYRNNPEVSDHEKFLVGLAFLEINNANNAIGLFNDLNKDGNNYKPDAEFYLGLAHLKTKHYDTAQHLLTTIYNNSSHPYNQYVSRSLIKNIKMLKWKD